MILAGAANLFEDALLDLTDPHPGKTVDLSDLLKGMRTILCRDHHTVVTFRVWDPVLTPLSLAVYAVFGLNCKTRRPI